VAAGDFPVFVTYFWGHEIRFAALPLFLLVTFRLHSPHLLMCVPFLFKVYSFGFLIQSSALTLDIRRLWWIQEPAWAFSRPMEARAGGAVHPEGARVSRRLWGGGILIALI